jgi:lipopolysaccharide/colanic/teichoic acid biosynthesis glycosyltransferase
MEVVAASAPEAIRVATMNADAAINLVRMNDIRFINKFLKAAHSALADNAVFVVCFESLQQRRVRIRRKYPRWFAMPYYVATFMFHRIFSKLPLFKRAYFAFTKGRNRPLSRAEVLGRLQYCGFDIVDMRAFEQRQYVVARKARPPRIDASPSYGPFFTMRRVGQHGHIIHVYKLRTMHPYSEYLQEYVYQRNRLADGGKLRRDFRVTVWGQWMRRMWIDELPMLINWVRRDLKFVGVRPLSTHYESLYPDELRERRRRVKPGLVPPFYADMPRTFEEILASEDRYLRACEQSTWRTDLRYFARSVYNIVVRRARSR